jgi:hypothetical protein
MSTRCNIHFTYDGDVQSNVYVHSDGYPDGIHGIPARLKEFFAELESQTSDRRYGDPEYLAAKFVVWVAGQYARDPAKPLEFLSVGVCLRDHADIEFVYTVECGTRGADSRPVVTWKSSR